MLTPFRGVVDSARAISVVVASWFLGQVPMISLPMQQRWKVGWVGGACVQQKSTTAYLRWEFVHLSCFPCQCREPCVSSSCLMQSPAPQTNSFKLCILATSKFIRSNFLTSDDLSLLPCKILLDARLSRVSGHGIARYTWFFQFLTTCVGWEGNQKQYPKDGRFSRFPD